MHLVAIGATHFVGGVRASSPVVRGVALVAAQTHRILARDRRSGRPRAEFDDARRLSPFGFDMRSSRSMAGLTLETAVPERSPRVVGLRVLGTKERQYLRIIVAAQTRVGPLGAVGSR